MKKITLITLLIVWGIVAKSQDVTPIYEKAKLQMLCQAVQFNCLQQGKTEIAIKLDCSDLQTLEKTIPVNFKASKTLLQNFKNRGYTKITDLSGKLDRLQKDISAELKGLGNRLYPKDKAAQNRWQRGLDSLNIVFEKTRQDAIAQLPEGTSNPEIPKNKTPEITTTEQENTVTPITITDGSKNADTDHTGLWIITILAILISFLSIGYAYLISRTTSHRIREWDKLLRERYNHLDARLDKMATKEDVKNTLQK
jgi:hypothetical protein